MIDIEPKLMHVNSFIVSGLHVRTINKDEFNPETAQLPGLWGRFFAEGMAAQIPDRVTNTPVFGVYSDYNSDASDYYTLTAGVQVNRAPDNQVWNTVQIQPGTYLVFSDNGEMPQVLIKTWQKIWSYFASNSQYQRSFATDFEVYSGAENISIYIGVES